MKLCYALALSSSIALMGPALAQPGTLDPSFDGDGIAILLPGDLHDVAYDVIALADNSVLLCGVAQHNGTNAIFITHLLEDGSVDAAFGTEAGYSFFNIGEEAYGYAMAIDATGNIHVCGLAYPTFAQSAIVVVRTDAAGIPDANFGVGGVATLVGASGDLDAKGICVLESGKVILAGSMMGVDMMHHAMLVRLRQDGSLDGTFGIGGFAMVDGLAGESLLNDVALFGDGTIVGVGYTDVNFVMKTIVVKTDVDGAFIGTFGTGGVLMPSIGATDHSAWGALVVGNRALVTGTVSNATESDVFVTRIREDGGVDPAFGGGLPVLVDMDDYEVGFDLASANGQIYVCGTTGQPGFGSPRDLFVAKMNGDGVLNEAFGSGGAVVTSIQTDFDDANAMAIQPDGKLVAAGFTSGFSTFTDNDVAVVRYFDDGSLATPNIEAAVGAQVFPNPAMGSTVTVRTECQGMLQIAVQDASGRLVRSLTEVNSSGTLALDIADLPNGHYLVRLTGAGKTEQRALVIQR